MHLADTAESHSNAAQILSNLTILGVSTDKSDRIGVKLRKAGFRPKHPVVIVPGQLGIHFSSCIWMLHLKQRASPAVSAFVPSSIPSCQLSCRLRDNGPRAVGEQAMRGEALSAAALGDSKHAASHPVRRTVLGRAHGAQPGAASIAGVVNSQQAAMCMLEPQRRASIEPLCAALPIKCGLRRH